MALRDAATPKIGPLKHPHSLVVAAAAVPPAPASDSGSVSGVAFYLHEIWALVAASGALAIVSFRKRSIRCSSRDDQGGEGVEPLRRSIPRLLPG